MNYKMNHYKTNHYYATPAFRHQINISTAINTIYINYTSVLQYLFCA